jgi:hypothetical protein
MMGDSWISMKKIKKPAPKKIKKSKVKMPTISKIKKIGTKIKIPKIKG